MRVDVDDVDVVEGLHEVGTRNDLAGFVERDFREGKLVSLVRLVSGGWDGFVVDEGAGEDHGGGLRCVSEI